jgi:hypothetical protein
MSNVSRSGLERTPRKAIVAGLSISAQTLRFPPDHGNHPALLSRFRSTMPLELDVEKIGSLNEDWLEVFYLVARADNTVGEIDWIPPNFRSTRLAYP